MTIQFNSQNYGKTVLAMKEITLYLNRRVDGLHGINDKKNIWWFAGLKKSIMIDVLNDFHIASFVFPHESHPSRQWFVESKGDFLKDFAVEFRFLENSALAIVETIVLGRLKCLQPLHVIFLVAKKLTISPFCHSSSLTLILWPLVVV